MEKKNFPLMDGWTNPAGSGREGDVLMDHWTSIGRRTLRGMDRWTNAG